MKRTFWQFDDNFDCDTTLDDLLQQQDGELEKLKRFATSFPDRITIGTQTDDPPVKNSGPKKGRSKMNKSFTKLSLNILKENKIEPIPGEEYYLLSNVMEVAYKKRFGETLKPVTRCNALQAAYAQLPDNFKSNKGYIKRHRQIYVTFPVLEQIYNKLSWKYQF